MLSQEIDKVISENVLPNEKICKPGKDKSESVQSGSYCSCSACDLDTCFALRNQKSTLSCTCSLCKNPDTCAISNKNVSDKQSNSENINDINIQKQIEQIEKELCSEITKIANTERLDSREYTKFSYKDVLLKRNKNKTHDKSTTRQYVRSVSINYLPNERKNSTAELTAQVMNMPYQDFKDSLTVENSRQKTSSVEIKSYPSIEKFRKISFTPHKPSFDFRDITKQDFLTRLKEIYNACSCKVCECITGTSIPISTNECKCKPCACDECTYNMNKQRNSMKNMNDGCPCVSCDRKDCRGVVKKNDKMSCSCVPCDCIKCAEDFPTSCDCEPCECIECKALGASFLRNRTVIVAPVHENVQNNLCQCGTCDCVNCTQNYSSMASSLRRQVSTEVVSNRNCRCNSCSNDTCQLNGEDCRCAVQNKVMKKPMERASHDYDIHSTLISSQRAMSKFNNHDTIVTFALCNNSCNTITYSNNNVSDCYCSNCKCILCKDKGKLKEVSKETHSEVISRCSKPSLDSFNTCKCSPCECQICSKNNKHSNKIKEENSKTSCEDNKCDCLVCKGSLNTKNKNIGQNKVTGLLFSETNNFLSEKSNFSRKGRILIPSKLEVENKITSENPSSINLSEINLKRKPKQISYINVPANHSSSINRLRHKIVTACHTVSKQRITDEIVSENSKYLPNDILLKECIQTIDELKYTVDEMCVFRKSTTFSEKGADNDVSDNKLCEIFNANNPNPIRDIELLDTIIHLAKSLSKTDVSSNEFIMNSENVSKNKYCDDNDEKHLFDRTDSSIPLTSKESVHTILLSTMDLIDKKIDKEYNFERLHSVSSKTFILCGKKSSSMVSHRNITHNMGSISVTNNLESDFTVTNVIIPTDSMLCETSYTEVVSDIADSKSHTLNNDLKVKDTGTTADKSKTKLINRKSTVKCVGKKYNKMYIKLNKMKQNKYKVKEDAKDNKVSNSKKCPIFVGRDICPPKDEHLENLGHSGNDRKHSVLQTTSSLTMDPHNVIDTKNALHSIMETQTQNIVCSDDSEAWSVTRKNLYINEPYVSRVRDVCTIPELDIDRKTSLKSISMQTSTFTNNIERPSGKHALTKLLLEVHDLLKSPLLESSYSNKNYDRLQENFNCMSKRNISLEFKTVCTDATSQTRANFSPIDKETHCNLIQSKGFLPRNTKLVTENVLTNAAYKSEQLSMKRDLVQNMPKINSCKSSCHGLKATFIGLRTISDHTVMLRWRLPREVACVQGYEIQVDGRPVQKIFSPTRCMAILTCLPHSEKLLLTIRTLATANLMSDHQPASTIVYRPRAKC